MANGFKDFKTLGELGIYVQGKFEVIESAIKEVKESPDKMGKWLIRVVMTLIAVAQLIILYKTIGG